MLRQLVSFRPGAQESFAKEKASFCSFARDLLTRSQIFTIKKKIFKGAQA
jgi:hypothetical protein